jgi:hypothetical protein
VTIVRDARANEVIVRIRTLVKKERSSTRPDLGVIV